MNAIRFYNPWVERNLLDDLFNSMAVNDKHDNGSCGCVPANVVENENNFAVQLSVPGFSKEEIRIQVQKNVLSIRSEKSAETQKEVKYVSREFGKRSFERKFMLPKNLDTENITATFHDGILEISVPKKEEVVEKTTVEIPIQ
jgi:HSP20 family protein